MSLPVGPNHFQSRTKTLSAGFRWTDNRLLPLRKHPPMARPLDRDPGSTPRTSTDAVAVRRQHAFQHATSVTPELFAQACQVEDIRRDHERPNRVNRGTFVGLALVILRSSILVNEKLRFLSSSPACTSLTVGDCRFLMDGHCLAAVRAESTGSCRVSALRWDEVCSSLCVLSLVWALSKESTSLMGRTWVLSDSRRLTGLVAVESSTGSIKENGNSTAFPTG